MNTGIPWTGDSGMGPFRTVPLPKLFADESSALAGRTRMV